MRNVFWLVSVTVLSAMVLLAGCKSEGDKNRTAAGSKPVTYQTVNSICPIEGGKFDPSAVSVELTAEFEGQRIGFCCLGCPAAWAKLSDVEKRAKLKEVLALQASDSAAPPMRHGAATTDAAANHQ
jgi:hypothetical protein